MACQPRRVTSKRSAVFGAFTKVYRTRTSDLFRIATEGTGVLREGDLHPDLVNRLAEEVERDNVWRTVINAQRSAPEATGADAIAVAARDVAETLDVKAVCAWTLSGSTALRIARERPGPAVLALTPRRETARRLSLVWGVHAVVTKDTDSVDDMAARACKLSNREGFSKEGDRIVIVAGVPFGTPGATNMIRIAFTEKGG